MYMMVHYIKAKPTYTTEAELALAYPDLVTLTADERNELILQAETYVDVYVGWQERHATTAQGQIRKFPRKGDCCGVEHAGMWDASTGDYPQFEQYQEYDYVPNDYYSANSNYNYYPFPRFNSTDPNLPYKWKIPVKGEYSQRTLYYEVSVGGVIDGVTYVAGEWAIFLWGEWVPRATEPAGCECSIPYGIQEATKIMANLIKLEGDIISSATGSSSSTSTTTSASCIEAGMSVRIGPMTIKRDSNSESVSASSYFSTERCCGVAFSGSSSYIKQFLGAFEYGRRFMALLDPFVNKLSGHR